MLFSDLKEYSVFYNDTIECAFKYYKLDFKEFLNQCWMILINLVSLESNLGLWVFMFVFVAMYFISYVKLKEVISIFMILSKNNNFQYKNKAYNIMLLLYCKMTNKRS